MIEKSKRLVIEVYKDIDGQWRWRFLRKAFGKTFIVADSAEAYKNRADAISALEHIALSFGDCNFEVVSPKPKP